MTVWHVRKGSSGDGLSPVTALGSLAAAVAVVRPGDEVRLEGVFRETLKPTAGTTWRAAEGKTAVLNGGWSGKAQPSQRIDQCLIREPDVTLIGLEFCNVPGRAVTVTAGGDRAQILDCYIHDTYNGGVGVNGMGKMVPNVVIRGCRLIRVSLSSEVKTSGGGGVEGNCLFRWAKNVLVEDCYIAGGHGEGMAAGVESDGVTIRGCTIHTNAHLLIYASNRAQNVLVENCVFYQTGDPRFRQRDGDVGTGVVVGDEIRPDDKDDRWQKAENVEVRYCTVVNGGSLFGVRNNLKPAGGGYDGYQTVIQNLYVHHCTFVAGPDTRGGINVRENPAPPPRVRGRFEDNVVVLRDASQWDVDAPGFVALRNAFTILPPGLDASNVRIKASEQLVNAAADVTGTLDDHSFDLNNYRPLAGSAVAAAGLGALAARPGTPDPEPPEGPEPPEEPPPGVNWDSLIDRAARIGTHLAAQAVELEEVERLIAALDARHAALVAKNDEVAIEMGELLLALQEYKDEAAEGGEES